MSEVISSHLEAAYLKDLGLLVDYVGRFDPQTIVFPGDSAVDLSRDLMFNLTSSAEVIPLDHSINRQLYTASEKEAIRLIAGLIPAFPRVLVVDDWCRTGVKLETLKGRFEQARRPATFVVLAAQTSVGNKGIHAITTGKTDSLAYRKVIDSQLRRKRNNVWSLLSR